MGSITDPNGNQVCKSYSANSLGTTFSFNSGGSVNNTTMTLDAYGRLINTQRQQGPGSANYDTVSAAYSFTGGGSPNQAYISTNIPCTTALNSTCPGTNWIFRDMLGRVGWTSTPSEGEYVQTQYLSQDVFQTLAPAPSGENTKSVQTEYDFLGRPISRCAISNTVSGSTPCGQKNGSYSGILTDTSYGSSSNGQQWMSSGRGQQTRTKTVDSMGRLVGIGTPEGGVSLYYYDTAGCYGTNYPGHLTAASVTNGNSYCYAYDTLGRLTLEYGLASSGATLCRQFFYDNSQGATGTVPSGITITNPYGRMVEAETANCSSLSTPITDEWFSYDKDGDIIDMWELTPHSTQYYHSTATFAGNGVVTSLQLVSPSLYTMNYTLDGEGRWNTMAQGSSSVVTGPKPPTQMYNAAGQPIEVDLTGSDKDLYTYDPYTGNMTQYEFEVGGANETGVLTWNPNNTLQGLAVTDGFNSGGSQTCASSYDDLARLIVFDCGSGNWGQNFGYDQYDNLAQTVIPPDRTGGTWNPGYSVSPSNNHVIGATYDGSGNMTNDGGMNVYGYDQFNKVAWTAGSGTPICGTSGKCITYDAFGRMVEKSNGGAWSEIWYTQVPDSQITMSGTTASYGYWPSPGRGTFVASGSNTFLHQDWLGNDRIVSAVSGHTVSADRAYAPYGEQYNTFGSTNPIYGMFAGIAGDFDPGVLFDTPNRELAQYQGRWISPDPAGAGWNQYAYATNPLSNTDPTGLDDSCGDPKFRALCQAGNSSPYNGLPSIFAGWSSGWDFSESLEYPIQINTTSYIYHPPSLIVGQKLYDIDGNPTSVYFVQQTTGGWSATTSTTGYMYIIPASSFAAGMFYPGQSGKFNFAKNAANDFMKKPITNPPGTPGPPETPPDLGGRDLEAIEAFEKMIHGLMLIMENGEIQFAVPVMPAPETCLILNNCGDDIHHF